MLVYNNDCYFAKEAGAGKCSACPKGSFSNANGASSCQDQISQYIVQVLVFVVLYWSKTDPCLRARKLRQCDWQQSMHRMCKALARVQKNTSYLKPSDFGSLILVSRPVLTEYWNLKNGHEFISEERFR